MRLPKIAGLAALVLVLPPAWGQQEEPVETDLVEQAERRLMQIDVTVRGPSETLAALTESGVEPQAAEPAGEGPLSGRVFVFTGGMTSMSRDDAKAAVEALGARTANGVSKKVTDVVAGEDAGSKLAKAQKLGLRIHDEEAFGKILEQA